MTRVEHKKRIERIKYLMEFLGRDIESSLCSTVWNRIYDIGDGDSVDMNTTAEFFLTGRDEYEFCIKITHTLKINDIENIAYDIDLFSKL